MIRTHVLHRGCVLALMLTATALSQTAYLSYGGSGTIRNIVLPNDACGPTWAQVPIFGGGSFCFGTPPLGGGLAIDQSANHIFETNGFNILASPSPLYASTCAMSPLFTSGCGVAITGFTSGFATGLAIEPHCGIVAPGIPGISKLWVTNGTAILSLDTATALLVDPETAVTGLPLSTILTGLEFDYAAGDLVACASNGASYRISVPLGIVTGTIAAPAAYIGAGSPTVTCNVLDRGAGTAGAYYICGGGMVFPTMGTYASEPPFPSGVIQAQGGAFSAEPVLLRSDCSCPGFLNRIYSSKPPVCEVAPVIDLGIESGPPFTPAFLVLSPMCCDGYPLPILTPCTLWTCLPPATIFSAQTTGQGDAVGLTVGTLPCWIGATFYAQWVYLCPDTQIYMTDAMHIRISHP